MAPLLVIKKRMFSLKLYTIVDRKPIIAVMKKGFTVVCLGESSKNADLLKQNQNIITISRKYLLYILVGIVGNSKVLHNF